MVGEKVRVESSLTSAVVTLCSANDVERCRLLCDTMDSFVPRSVKHYVVVDRRDSPRLADLASGRREVFCVEDLLPAWIMRVPGAIRWWLSLKSAPIRNWILQQLAKLAVGAHVEEDVLIFADADVAFVRSFDPADWVRGGRVRLFRRPGANPINHVLWHRTAGKLLGLEAREYFGASYIGNLVAWRRDNVLKLHEHIREVNRRGWLEAVCRSWRLSEYILYGVFADCVLGDSNGHYYDSAEACLSYWGDQQLSEEQIREFLRGLNGHHAAVMISSKADIPTQRYEALLGARCCQAR